MVPVAMIWAGSGVEQWLDVVGAIWLTAGKLRLRGVDGSNVAGAGARVVHIAGAESATDGQLGNGRTGKADARRKVGEVRINKRLAVNARS